MGSGISSPCQTSKSVEVRNSLRSLRDPDTRRPGRKTTLVGNNRVHISPRKENVSTNTRRSNRKIDTSSVGSTPNCPDEIDSKNKNDRNNNSNSNNNKRNLDDHRHGILQLSPQTNSRTWAERGMGTGSNCELNTVLSDSCDSGIMEENRKRCQLMSRSRRDQFNSTHLPMSDSNTESGDIPNSFDPANSFDSRHSRFTLKSDSEISTDYGFGKSTDSFTNSSTSAGNDQQECFASPTNNHQPPVLDTRYNRPISKPGSVRPNRRSAPNMLQLSIDEAEEDDEMARLARPPRPKSAYVRKRRGENYNHSNDFRNSEERTNGDVVDKEDDEDDDDDFWSAESITSDDEDFYSDILSIPDETTPGLTPRGEANVKLGPKFNKVTTTTTSRGTSNQNEDWWTALTPLESEEVLTGLPSSRTPSTFRSWAENSGGDGGNNLGKKASERSLSSVILLSPYCDASEVPENAYPISARSPRTPIPTADTTNTSINNNYNNFDSNSQNCKSLINDIITDRPDNFGNSHSECCSSVSEENSSAKNTESNLCNGADLSVNNFEKESNNKNNLNTNNITKRKSKIFKNKKSTTEKNYGNIDHANTVTSSFESNNSNTFNNNDGNDKSNDNNNRNNNDIIDSNQKHFTTNTVARPQSISSHSAQHVSNITNTTKCCECLHANPSTTTTTTASNPQHQPECHCQKTITALEEQIFTLVLSLTQNPGVSLVDFQNMVVRSRPQFLQALDCIPATTQHNQVAGTLNANCIPALESRLAQCLYNIRESADPNEVSALVLRQLSALKSLGAGAVGGRRTKKTGGGEEEEKEYGKLKSRSFEERDHLQDDEDRNLIRVASANRAVVPAASSNPVITGNKEARDITQAMNVREGPNTQIVAGLPPSSSTSSLGRGHTMINGSKERSRTAIGSRTSNEQSSIISDSQIGTHLVENTNKSPSAKKRPDSGIVVSSSASYSSSSEATRETEIDVTSQTEWIAKSLEMLQEIYTVQTQDHDSTKSLVKAITKNCDSDQLKAHAIYRWLSSQSLAYYAKSLTGCKLTIPTSRLKQLADGKINHATLFQEMARSAGLRSEKIDGYAKGDNYLPGSPIRSPANQHSWNAVSFNGHYALIDSKFGALPYKFFVEHYFMTPPDEFRLSHYPKDKKWLLMTQAFSLEDFDATLKTWPTMVAFNIRPLNMKSVLRTYDGRLSITVLLRSVAVTPQLEYTGPGPQLDSDSLALLIDQEIRSVDNAETFHVSLPQEGTYFFTLLVHDIEEDEDIPVFQYRIEYSDELL